MEILQEGKYLYIVSTVSLKELSENDLKKDFELHKVQYPGWKNKTFQEYCEFKKGWGRDKYELSQEDNSYFLDFEKAKECVERNFADINDGGAYNYTVIKRTPLEKAYAMTYVEELHIFKYDNKTSTYKELPLDTNNETKYIASTMLMFY